MLMGTTPTMCVEGQIITAQRTDTDTVIDMIGTYTSDPEGAVHTITVAVPVHNGDHATISRWAAAAAAVRLYADDTGRVLCLQGNGVLWPRPAPVTA